ncbi:MAG: DUF3164 family protein [Bacteroides sp.]|nr:DUF3164 family protein [Prevotella sp.]MCM1407073.1 DUF3164 family protein [Treponema brennaborense]MCM1470225.1 DUF3164 family protein [Bacteroides sp.]
MAKESKEYLEDAQGRLTPVSAIKPFDMKRHDTVTSIMKDTFAERDRLIEFKRSIWVRVQEFLSESAKDSGSRKFGGAKGNVTLTSFDGKYKVIVAVNDTILFNEKLQVAKQLIDKCIANWSEGANENLRAIVDDAFNVGKSGLVSTSRVLGLRRLNIKDATWKKAMDAISESMQVASSKTYMRFYERVQDGSYKQIPLDVAAL